MQLTPSQLTTLKNYVVANHNAIFDQSTADALNVVASPDYYVLKSSVPVNEIMFNGFDWTIVDNASVGQWRIWEAMCSLFAKDDGAGSKTINPSKIEILKGTGEAWKGNTPAGTEAHRRAIQAHYRRLVRIWEKLFVTATASWNVGTNADQTGARGVTTNPDTLGVGADGEYLGGLIDVDTLIAAANS